eukprot:CCRYP_017149-RA/>CCRYP_017149-RA protein AED:0.38 eAED:0.38 QI:0/0/0/1/0/0/3/0/164
MCVLRLTLRRRCRATADHQYIRCHMIFDAKMEDFRRKARSTVFLAGRGDNPLPCDYAPEEDVTPLLEPGVATYYMQLIGVLRWMCELGRIDICTEVSMLSSFAAMPRGTSGGGTARSRSNSRLIFDPKEPNVGESDFVECDWSDFYPARKRPCRLMPQTPLARV